MESESIIKPIYFIRWEGIVSDFIRLIENPRDSRVTMTCVIAGAFLKGGSNDK